MAGRRKQRRQTHAPVPAPPAPPEAAGAWIVLGRPAVLLALGVALVALALYAFTLAPTVALIDSGELTLAARDLGVAHPPGTPLWVLLAHLATRLPWGSVAQRVNASSALFAALAAGALVLTWRAARLGRVALAAVPEAGRVSDLVPAAVAGLLLATSRTLWSYATLAEVYALNAAMLVGVLGLVLRARQADAPARWLYGAAALFGLALGVHHVTVALTLPALVALLLGARPELRQPRRWLPPALTAAAAAAVVYALLPLTASRAPLVSWGDPSNWQRFVWQVSGRQYQAFLDPTAESVANEAAAFAQLVLREFGPPWAPLALLLGCLGALALWRRDRVLLVSFGLLALCDVSYALVYTVSEDKAAYYLPTWIVLALLAGFGAERALRAAGTRTALVSAALLAAPLVGLASSWPQNDRREFRVADELVTDALAAVRPGGLLFTCEWQLYSPWLYYREVEGRRPDALLIDAGLLRRSWYFATLRRQAPELMRRAEPTLAPFLEDLRAWEQDPGLYERDRGLNQRINERFQEMVLGLAAAHQGPLYATSDMILPDATPDPGLARRLLARYTPAPLGLVFELGEGPASRAPAPALQASGLFEPGRFAPDDVVVLKLRPLYVSMQVNRGRFLEATSDWEGAGAAYRQALAWDPQNGIAQAGLERLARAGAR